KKLTEFNSRTQEYKNETNKQIDKIDNIKESLASFNKTEENQSNYLNQLIEEKQNLEAHHKELNDYLLIYDLNKEQTETEIKENIEETNNKEENNLTNQTKLNKQLHQLEINLAESEERLKYQKERHTSIENEYQSLIEKEKELKLKLNDLDEISKEEKTSKE